ncbi:MAG: DUF2007 domain-containing protein [Planctomycetota bacterium]
MDIPLDEKLVTLATLAGEIEATLLADELKRQGIAAEASGLLTAGFRAEAPGSVKVLVHEQDLDEAKAVMADYYASKEEIDWDQVDVGEAEDEL